jgi:hypothetical protein
VIVCARAGSPRDKVAQLVNNKGLQDFARFDAHLYNHVFTEPVGALAAGDDGDAADRQPVGNILLEVNLTKSSGSGKLQT